MLRSPIHTPLHYIKVKTLIKLHPSTISHRFEIEWPPAPAYPPLGGWRINDKHNIRLLGLVILWSARSPGIRAGRLDKGLRGSHCIKWSYDQHCTAGRESRLVCYLPLPNTTIKWPRVKSCRMRDDIILLRMFSKLDLQIFTIEFESHSYSFVPYLNKKISKFVGN